MGVQIKQVRISRSEYYPLLEKPERFIRDVVSYFQIQYDIILNNYCYIL